MVVSFYADVNSCMCKLQITQTCSVLSYSDMFGWGVVYSSPHFPVDFHWEYLAEIHWNTVLLTSSSTFLCSPIPILCKCVNYGIRVQRPRMPSYIYWDSNEHEFIEEGFKVEMPLCSDGAISSFYKWKIVGGPHQTHIRTGLIHNLITEYISFTGLCKKSRPNGTRACAAYSANTPPAFTTHPTRQCSLLQACPITVISRWPLVLRAAALYANDRQKRRTSEGEERTSGEQHCTLLHRISSG